MTEIVERTPLTTRSVEFDPPGAGRGHNSPCCLHQEPDTALGLHRAWDRAPLVMAPAVPPAV